jgi:predicted amidophosphoribosyltransferase
MVMLISIWVLCGIIAVMLATNKGERDIKLLLFCSIGGPVGLAYVFKRRNKPKVFCPFCSEEVDTIGDSCSLCGLDLGRIEAGGDSIKSMQCPRCGKGNVHDAFIEHGAWGKWCPDCKMSIKKIRRSGG